MDQERAELIARVIAAAFMWVGISKIVFDLSTDPSAVSQTTIGVLLGLIGAGIPNTLEIGRRLAALRDDEH